MTHREEELLGFQLIRKVNYGNIALHQASLTMIGRDEPTDPKAIIHTFGKIIATEVQERLAQFISRVDDELLQKCLGLFKISLNSLRGDAEEILLHWPNVDNVLELLPDTIEWVPHGELLGLYKERVELEVQPKTHISPKYGPVNSYQNTLNAIAFELQGLCQGTGEMLHFSTASRKAIVEERLKDIPHHVRRCPDTEEVRKFNRAARQVSRRLPELTSESDLEALGKELNKKVPQLPILYRWWNN